MSTPEIKGIYGLEPMREGEWPVGYTVLETDPRTKRMITHIEHEEWNRGDHGVGWFVVYSAGDVIARMGERAVAEIHYATTEQE